MNQNIIRDFENLCHICSQTRDALVLNVALSQCMKFKDAFPGEEILDQYLQFINYIAYYLNISPYEAGKKNDEDFKKFFGQHKKELLDVIPTFEAYKDIDINYSTLDYDFLNWLKKEFIMSLGYEFYNFYCYYADSGRISARRPGCKEKIYTYDPGAAAGVMIPLHPYDYQSVIYLNKYNDINDLMNLMHELGHAYFHYVNRCGFMDYISAKDNIKTEIPSKMMEQLFIRFLYQNGFNEFANALSIQFSKAARRSQIDSDMCNCYKYCLGSFISQIFINDIGTNYTLEEFFNYIHCANYQELLQICKANNPEKGKTKRKFF